MRKWLLTLVVCGLFVLGGCNARHTRENYEKIQPGMTRQEVQDILGKPFRDEGDEAEYWGPNGKFEIEFDDFGRVKEKEWD